MVVMVVGMGVVVGIVVVVGNVVVVGMVVVVGLVEVVVVLSVVVVPMRVVAFREFKNFILDRNISGFLVVVGRAGLATFSLWSEKGWTVSLPVDGDWRESLWLDGGGGERTRGPARCRIGERGGLCEGGGEGKGWRGRGRNCLGIASENGEEGGRWMKGDRGRWGEEWGRWGELKGWFGGEKRGRPLISAARGDGSSLKE